MTNYSFTDGFKAAQYKTFDEHAELVHTEPIGSEYSSGIIESGLASLVVGSAAVIASYALDFPLDDAVRYISFAEMGTRVGNSLRVFSSSRIPQPPLSTGLVGTVREVWQKAVGTKSIDDTLETENTSVSKDVLNL